MEADGHSRSLLSQQLLAVPPPRDAARLALQPAGARQASRRASRCAPPACTARWEAGAAALRVL